VTARIAGVAALVIAVMAASTASAEDAPPEIEYLLTTMGQSDCRFIRNGKTYDAGDAEDHLRMKYWRGKRYASSAEEFIDNLASRSSMSRKPYLIACEGAEQVETGPWLHELLDEYRSRKQPPAGGAPAASEPAG
jgi:hypothetical protein